MDDQQVRRLVATAEQHLADIEALADPKARFTATQAVQLLLDLYGEGLARLVGLLQEAGADELLETCADDELLSHLLLLHGLHPIPVTTRIERSLAAIGDTLQKQGAEVTFVGIEAGVAQFRLLGRASGCSVASLQQMVETAVLQAAPDLEGIQLQTPGSVNGGTSTMIPLATFFEAEGGSDS